MSERCRLVGCPRGCSCKPARVSRAFALLVGLSLLGAPAFAEAQTKSLVAMAPPAKKKPTNPKDPKLLEAKRLFEAGEELYAKGDYEKAIESWEMSFELSGKELILESIANAYERLGNAEKAREYLGRWREAAPADEHADLDARLGKLDQRIAKEKAEKEAKEKADKEAKEKADAADRQKAGESKLFLPGVIIGGVGAAAAVTGGVLDILAGMRRPDASAVCAESTDGKTLCRASAKDDIEKSNTFAMAGDILLIGGGVAAAVGVVLVITQSGPKKGKEDQKTAIAPWVLPGGGGGLLVGGSF